MKKKPEYKPDWADRISSATTHMRYTKDGKVHRWDYEYPGNAWEGMPWFVRWTLVTIIAVYLIGSVIAVVTA